MKRSRRSKGLAMEITVGVFVFAVLLGLAVFTIMLGGEALFRTAYTFEVVFSDVMGLREGDDVVFRGMPIGKVSNLSMTEDGVHVTASIREPVHLREDYRVEVIMSSVLGGRFMQINAGSPDAPRLPPDAPVTGRPPHDLISEATALTAFFRSIADKINEGEGTLGRLVHDDELYLGMRDSVEEIRAALKERQLLERLEASVADFQEIAGKINRGEGTLGRLVNDDELYLGMRDSVEEIRVALKERQLLERLEASVADFQEIAGKINRGEGTLGRLVHDDELYKEVRQAIRDASAAMDDMRETAPLVTFTSILFGAF